MGAGASNPNKAGGTVTRVTPSSQAVSEANTIVVRPATSEGFAVAKSVQSNTRSSLEKLVSLSDRASPEQVLQLLLDGNGRFLSGTSIRPHQDFNRLVQISDKQKPHAAILGCADSRVPAEIVFDQGFGDVFVCRVAGNIATPEEVASLEYAVLDLGVKVVMVLGHTKCGAVKAALSGKAFPGFIDTLVDHLDVAIARVDPSGPRGPPTPEIMDKVVRENVRYQVQRCQRSTIIQEGIQKQELMLVGAVYNLDTGKVQVIVTKGGLSDNSNASRRA